MRPSSQISTRSAEAMHASALSGVMIGLAGVMRSILTRLEVGRIGGERFRFLSSAWRENGMDKRACYPRFSLKNRRRLGSSATKKESRLEAGGPQWLAG
jgi:hypothetical protein